MHRQERKFHIYLESNKEEEIVSMVNWLATQFGRQDEDRYILIYGRFALSIEFMFEKDFVFFKLTWL